MWMTKQGRHSGDERTDKRIFQCSAQQRLGVSRFVMTVFRTIIERGYFPKELPPLFYTENFARYAESKAGRKDLDTFKPPDNYTECVDYELARPGHLVRSLALPHPAAFSRLARLTAKSFRRLLKKAHKSSFSRSAPVYSAQAYRSIHPRLTMGYLARERASARGGARSLVQADVSQFYPSLYTHAVGWAIDQRLRERSFYKKNKSNLGALLDQCLMDQQRKVSQGIPIGNDISFLVAEIVLSQVDEALDVDPKRSYRWFDDYEFSCDTRAEAQAILGQLRTELRRFRLRTNPAKTGILELPAPADSTWRQSLLTEANHGLETDRDMVRYFDTAFRLRDEYPESAILGYAAGVLFRLLKPSEEAGRVALSALTQALLVEPGCAQKVFALLNYWRLNGFALDLKVLTRTIDRLIDQHAAGGVTSDVAWALSFCEDNKLDLSRRAAKLLSACEDDCIALQALHLNSIGLLVAGFSKTSLSKFAGSADLDGPHWLLCYEAARHGFLGTTKTAVAGHLLFSRMLAKGVTFLRTKLPPYATLLHQGGAPNWLAREWLLAVTGAAPTPNPIASSSGEAQKALVRDAEPFKDVVVDADDLRLRLLRINDELAATTEMDDSDYFAQ